MLATVLIPLCGGCAVAAASPIRESIVVQQPSRRAQLTAAQMFRLAHAALLNGDEATATAIFSALERDPDGEVRAEARFRHAQQLSKSKRYSQAALLLRRLLDEKPEASAVRLQLAQLLAELGDPESALRELRAAQASGLPPSVVRLVDRYSEALRQSRPKGASFEVAIAPDSNINHATSSDSLGTIFGDFDIGQESQGRSGIGLALRGQAYRRLGIATGDASLLVRLSGFADLYRTADFNDVAVDLAGGPEIRVAKNRINFELGVTQRWYGQQPFMRSGRISAALVRPLGSRMQARLIGSASLIDNAVNDLQDGKAYSGRISLERALSATAGAVLSLSAERQSLKDPGYSMTGWRAGLLGWRDLGRSTITVEGEIGRLKADERLLLFPDRRSDRHSRLSIGATFRQLTFGGFAPVARLVMERNRSSVEFYDYRRTRTEFGIQRAF